MMNRALLHLSRGVLVICLFGSSAFAKVIYVKEGSERGGDGASWDTAYRLVRMAIWKAEPGDEIWVAKGVYRPSDRKREDFYYLGTQVRMYGGFNGDEIAREDARPRENVTVLSGDLNGDDMVDENGVTLSYADQGTSEKNSSWCILRIKDAIGVVVDGFVICGGEGHSRGGGVICLGASEVTMSRCVVRGNKGKTGGGIYVSGQSQFTLRDSWVLGNYSDTFGGGITSDEAGVTAERCWIAGNRSKAQGGGISLHREGVTFVIRDSVISGNSAGRFGGAIQSWAANTLVDLTNVTVTGNREDESGSAAIHLGKEGRLVARNSILWGNEKSYNPGESTAIWTNCLLEGSCGSKEWSEYYGADGGGNVDFDPRFIEPLDWKSVPSIAGDFRLAPDSPVKGLGDASLTSSATDFSRSKRVMGDGIEIGAHEIFEESAEADSPASSQGEASWLPWGLGGGVAFLSILAWAVSRSKVTRARSEIGQMQGELQDVLEREKSFTSETSHELRTPIAVILGHCELALDQDRNPEQILEAVKACQKAGERMKSLTDDLLEISRLEEGKVDLELSECSIREVAEDALDIVESTASRKGVVLKDELCDATVMANGDRLWQVMVNLLNNAVRHTPEGKKVTLRVESKDDQLVIAVIDEGAGIPAEGIPHLFKKFYKGEDGDTGLGLAICETIIRGHRGTLTVESEPDVETRFVATLPL